MISNLENIIWEKAARGIKSREKGHEGRQYSYCLQKHEETYHKEHPILHIH